MSYQSISGLGALDAAVIQPTRPLCGNARNVQQGLKDLGFYSGPIDGILGKGSTSAIGAFSRARGIGNITWPNPVFCAELAKALDEANAPPPQVTPDGGVQPGSAIVTTPTGNTQVVAPSTNTPAPTPPEPWYAGDTGKIALMGGLGVTALLVVAVATGGRSSGEMTPNRRRRRIRRRGYRRNCGQ